METNNNLHAKEMTYWSLISDNRIIIPDIQRDYAQGRNDDEIKRIREGLIRSIINAVESKDVLNLNFIYGRLSDDNFVPIDGQQRLTTLFLFHWYVARRSGHFNDIYDTLNKFSYSTRDTSKRFCGYLCSIDEIKKKEYDFRAEKVSSQITNKSWFTGAFAHDPTVMSMLTVLDAIHTELKDKNDEYITNIYENFIGDANHCYVKFLLLPLEGYNEEATEDLYIKMNARGKLLTDFEIFKGMLQDSNALRTYATAPADINDSKKLIKIIDCIGLINNDYSEMFYKFAASCADKIEEKSGKDPLVLFDELMMKFFNEFCRYEFFLSRESSLATEQQRERIIGFSKLSVSDLWEHIEQIDGVIGKIFTLLYKLNINYKQIVEPTSDSSISSKGYFDNSILFNFFKSTYQINTLRYLSYSYLIENETIDENFIFYKRFIYNLIEKNGGTVFAKNPDISFRVAHFILKNINLKKNINMEISQLKPPFSNIAEIDQQLEEEVEKAKLILSSSEWKNAILQAEKYFVDGQIDFLLKLCKDENGYQIENFKNYFALSTLLFDGNKNQQESLDGIIFRKALLCMEDKTTDQTSYLLQSNSSKDSCWSFIKDCNSEKDGSFKELLRGLNTTSTKRDILLNLFRQLKERTSETNDHINIALKEIIDENIHKIMDKENWKNYFLDNNFDLFNSQWWKESEKSIYIKGNEILLLRRLKTSSYNCDIKTYILAKKHNNIDKLNWAQGKDPKYKNEFCRFLSIGKFRVAYDYENEQYCVSENNGAWEAKNPDEIFAR